MNFEGFTLVFCNGDPPSEERLDELIRRPVSVVCADGGAQKAIATGYTPDLIVGDLDSLDGPDSFSNTTEIVKIPSQENTDFEKTLDLMLERGMDNFLVTAFSGGRIDQTLANVQIAYEYSSRCHIVLADDEYVVFPVRDRIEQILRPGTAVSVIAMADETVVTTDGLAYELKSDIVPKGGHGVSNRSVKRAVKIRVDKGGILVLVKYA